MTSMVAVGTPLAEALSGVIQPKLVEMGWASEGGNDSALTEYVILMLVNNKSLEQITGELSNDLLGLDEGDTQALEFSRWLFEQVDTLNRQINGGGAPPSEEAPPQSIPSMSDEQTTGQAAGGDGAMDADMGDMGNGSIPTGPKAMRDGRQAGRGMMLNQINRAMDRNDRNDAALHGVRGQGGMGRINTHGRDNMKNRGLYQNVGGRMTGGRGMGGMGMYGNQMGTTAGNIMQMNPNDQMHLMSLLEEQARVMAQFMPGVGPPAINPAFQNGPQQGRSLFDRVEPRGPRPQAKRQQQVEEVDMDMSRDGQQDESNPNTVCRFNKRCTRRDCPFAHQSPAAPEGTLIDQSDVCSFGAACKNKKCTGRHPSPAVRSAHQAEELCKFFPSCANPHCSFKHPSMPLCRNGADCATEGCKFTHSTTACRFNPCLNSSCPYKHAEGQKGKFGDKVWTPGQAGDKPHVSDRKFVADENAPEELIKPDDAPVDTQNNQEVAT